MTRIVAWVLLDKSTRDVAGLYADEYGVTVVIAEANPSFRGYVHREDPCPLSWDGHGYEGWDWGDYYEKQQERRFDYDRKRIMDDQ